MKRLYVFFIMITFSLINLTADFSLSSDNKANEIIKKVKQRYEKIETIKADFIQKFHWKLVDNKHQQKGKIWLKGKDKFRIVTEDQVIISNGKTIWTYSKYNNQVIIDNVKNSQDVTLPRDIFLNYSEQYHTHYLNDKKLNDQNCYILELMTKKEDLFIKYMKIWINKKILVPIKIEQVDLNDNTNLYLLSNIVINEPFEKDFFNYQIPESVEVIDMR